MISFLQGHESLSEYSWIIIAGFIIAFFLSFSVGANDVANPFGTSVGSGALTLLQVCICATFMETLGAMTLGGAVSGTIGKGLVNSTLYEDQIPQFMLGQACAMLGAASWQILASVMKMPVSGTHSIVGAVLGFALVAQKGNGIQWIMILKIVSSWFISPILAGIMAVIMYSFLRKVILFSENKEQRALVILPFMYAGVIFLNVFSVLYTGSKIYQIDFLQPWHMLLIGLGVSIVVWIVCNFVFRPAQVKVLNKIRDGTRVHKEGCLDRVEKKLGWDTESRKLRKEEKERKRQEEEDEKFMKGPQSTMQMSEFKPKRNKFSGSIQSLASRISSISNSSVTSIYGVVKKKHEELYSNPDESEEDLRDGSEDENMRYLFSQLQAFSACLDAFAHGGNDVGNSIGPVLALWSIYQSASVEMNEAPSPLIIAYGCFGIVLGLWILGRRVIETVGEDIAEITPARGFSIDLMAGLTVLLGSNFGIPLSTTHCKVGAVVSVSLMHNRKAVSWRTFGNIAWAWIVTLPVSGAISAFSYWLITYLLFPSDEIDIELPMNTTMSSI